ncbi:MAG: metallophosphoesterase family protein [Candidatus Tectomicrobia bacterium]|nr:metallophosphoesterase family protein [Candidatus Tectomicrobia bacterium]
MARPRVVILSDTHGRLPGEVLRACRGADRVIHAGDVGSGTIIPELEAAAPLAVVGGNVDPSSLAPVRARVEAGGWRILVQHIAWERGGPSGEIQELLARQRADLVVFGHTHEPMCVEREGVVFLNPGSCGAKRFSWPRSYAQAVLDSREIEIRILDLDHPGAAIAEARFLAPGRRPGGWAARG